MSDDKLTCSIDGNCLSIVRKDFINLQESNSVFIELTKEQIKEIKELEEDEVKKFAEAMHELYEECSKARGWDTQDKCKVSFDDLPEKNRLVMLDVAHQILVQYIKKTEIKEIIGNHSRKGVRHYEDSWDIRPSDLLKEMGLE